MANQEIDSLSKSCSISGCTGKYKAKGFCGRHLQQIYKYGEIINIGRSKLDSNEIIIENNIAKMKLYDHNGNQIEETIFDSKYVNIISQYKWHLFTSTKYVGGGWKDNDVWKDMLLHRFLLYLEDGKFDTEVDHKDGNRLNNLISNLRRCTIQQNNQNAKKTSKITSSKYKGVNFSTYHMKFKASISVNKISIYLGIFSSEIDAAKAYNEAAIKYFGEFAWLNKFEEVNQL